jgi:hypothetical protein
MWHFDYYTVTVIELDGTCVLVLLESGTLRRDSVSAFHLTVTRSPKCDV